MARININVGTNANDGTGDDLRTAMQKINTNFTELYGTTAEANDLVEDGSPQLGGNLDLQTYIITTSATNGNITLTPNGTGNVVLGALTINGTTVSSDTSTKITLAESVDVTGTLSAPVIDTNIIQNSDSSAIQINDGVNINGVLNVKDLIVNEISSEDSSAIEIKEKLNVSGTLSAPFISTNAIFSTDSSEIVINDAVAISGALSVSTINTNVIRSPDSSAIQIEDGVNISGAITFHGSGLTFPDATVQTTAFTGNAATVDIMNTNGIDTNYSITFVENRDPAQDLRADVDLTFNSATNLLTVGNVTTSTLTANRIIETINNLTSSSTITVNCATALIHTVTLAESTGFVISNLPTGSTVTLIITQGGSGSYTASFGTDTSTTVKFSGGAPTLSTAVGAIDVITIFNDGVNYLGEFKANYIP